MRDLASLFDPALHIPTRLFELPSANIAKGWSDFLSQIELRMHDRAFAEGFRQAAPFEGADAPEYNYRLIEREGLIVVLSLRFKALSLTEPFIEVLLCDRVLDRDSLTLIRRVAKDEYSRFAPDRIRYFALDARPLLPDDQEDFAFFVGEINEIRKRPRPRRYSDVEVRPSASLEFYPKLQKVYQELDRETGQELTPEGRESLQSSLEQGLLYEAFIDGEWAGMISAHIMTERFLTGVFIVEEVIAEKFRGKGYAPAMQRKFIECLQDGKLVFGEILWWNERSRKTALRVGREKCGATFFHHV
ncbi:MAG TPA: GNAT family N-acetyltransferase [Candidatus Kapabacteria bacterium]|nr:GNAT family N-acetyltransferase [Candidatus Kapabacteria bacterium]